MSSMSRMTIATLAHNPTAALLALDNSHKESLVSPVAVLGSADGQSVASSSPSSVASSDELDRSHDQDQPSSPSSELDELAPPPIKDDVEMNDRRDDDDDAHRPQTASTLASTSSSSSSASPPLERLSPKWTNQWSGRAPPPKPLDTRLSRSVHTMNMQSPTGIVGGITSSRRHHPYASASGPSSRGVTTPSPTWPSHIGINDQGELHPSSLPHLARDSHPFSRAPASEPRSRAGTVAGGPPTIRPPGPLRHLSYTKYSSSSTSTMAASPDHERVMHFDVRRRSRGDSNATASTVDSYPSTTYPPSPLLFAPLTPQGQEHHLNKMEHEQQRSLAMMQSRPPHHLDRLPMPDDSPRVNTMALPPAYEQHHHHHFESPAVQRRSLQHVQGAAAAAPPSAPYFLQQHQQPPVLAKRRADSWQSVAPQHLETPPQPPAPTLAPSAAGPQIERMPPNRRRRRPPYSYSSLIAQAISSSPAGRMTLREIYTWISNAFPDMYSMDGPDSQGWQNTVRHNLSLNKSFVKVARTAQDIYDSCASSNPAHSQAARGKGGWWTIDPVVATAQLGPHYRGLDNNGNGTGQQTSPPIPQGFDRRSSAEGLHEERMYHPYPPAAVRPSVLAPAANHVHPEVYTPVYHQQPYGLGVQGPAPVFHNVPQSAPLGSMPLPPAMAPIPHPQGRARSHTVTLSSHSGPRASHAITLMEDRDVTPKAMEQQQQQQQQQHPRGPFANVARTGEHEEEISPRTVPTSTFTTTGVAAAAAEEMSRSPSPPASGRMAISDLLC